MFAFLFEFVPTTECSNCDPFSPATVNDALFTSQCLFWSYLIIFDNLLVMICYGSSGMTWNLWFCGWEECQIHLSVNVLDISLNNFDHIIALLHYFLSGLTWIFGFLAVKDAKFILQCLFCIFCSLQGLMIFIFHVASDK